LFLTVHETRAVSTREGSSASTIIKI